MAKTINRLGRAIGLICAVGLSAAWAIALWVPSDGLTITGVNVIGATLPGVPGILIGRNARIAWGLTNTVSDVQDLYLEKLDARFA